MSGVLSEAELAYPLILRLENGGPDFTKESQRWYQLQLQIDDTKDRIRQKIDQLVGQQREIANYALNLLEDSNTKILSMIDEVCVSEAKRKPYEQRVEERTWQQRDLLKSLEALFAILNN